MMVLLSLTDPTSDGSGSENPLTALFRRDRKLDEDTIEHARQIMPEALSLMMRSSESVDSTRRSSKLGLFGRASAALARLTFRAPDSNTVFINFLCQFQSAIGYCH